MMPTTADAEVAGGASGAPPSTSTSTTLRYREAFVDGIRVFFREAGPTNAPTVLLLHGYPSSSRMFDTLLPLLADQYHLVAPDYPGFGQSDAPSAEAFDYSFDHLADIVKRFTEQLGLDQYVMFIQDYGGPIGFRLALANPERIRGVVVQNAVASEDGLGPAWEVRKAYWRERDRYEQQVIPGFTSLEGAKARHVGLSPNPERYNPDTWLDEYAFLSRLGNQKIQADLFWTYQTNVAAYPAWQAWLRDHRPPILVVWGRWDPSFAVGGAYTYRKDVPEAGVHILDAGHFALDEKLDEIAALMRAFLARVHFTDGTNHDRSTGSALPSAT